MQGTNWVKFSDKKPDSLEDTLTHCGEMGVITIAVMMEDGRLLEINTARNINLNSASWMPLPPMPEGE